MIDARYIATWIAEFGGPQRERRDGLAEGGQYQILCQAPSGAWHLAAQCAPRNEARRMLARFPGQETKVRRVRSGALEP